MQTELPSQPWHFIASELSEVENLQYRLMTDPLGDEVRSPMTSLVVSGHMKMYRTLFGRPGGIVNDIGPEYSGQPFKRLIDSWGIKHVTSSPQYARSNGFIERSLAKAAISNERYLA